MITDCVILPFFFLDMLSIYIESLNIHRYTNFTLLGDFNINFLSPYDNSMLSKLLSLCNLFSFNQIVQEPTHVHHNGSSSLIDKQFTQ